METNYTDEDICFKVPVRLIIAGPTSVGKSEMVYKLIEFRALMFDKPFQSIFYYHAANMSTKDELFMSRLRNICSDIVIDEGLPNFEEISYYKGDKLVIIDDQILSIVNNADFFNAFTIYSNHHNISIIITSQNFFVQGKYSKTLMRNTTDKIVFRDKSDRQWLSILSRQMFPDKPNFLSKVMSWVQENVSNVYEQYIAIDNNPKSILGDDFLIKTNILPNDEGVVEPVYFSM
jgi:hypothetical protein